MTGSPIQGSPSQTQGATLMNRSKRQELLARLVQTVTEPDPRVRHWSDNPGDPPVDWMTLTPEVRKQSIEAPYNSLRKRLITLVQSGVTEIRAAQSAPEPPNVMIRGQEIEQQRLMHCEAVIADQTRLIDQQTNRIGELRLEIVSMREETMLLQRGMQALSLASQQVNDHQGMHNEQHVAAFEALCARMDLLAASLHP